VAQQSELVQQGVDRAERADVFAKRSEYNERNKDHRGEQSRFPREKRARGIA
jgi:hypothetical protein